MGPWVVASTAGVPVPTAEEWQSMGRFLQVRGVTPSAAGALVRSGVRTVAELARANPAALAATIQRSPEARRRWTEAESLDEATVAQWVQAARQRLSQNLVKV